MGDVLQKHRFARLRGRDDEGALALADRRNHVDDAAREVLVAPHVALENQRLVREDRREVLKEHAVLERLGRQIIHRVDAHERKVALALFRNADFAFNRVARMKVEAADLRGRDVDVVRAREIARVGAAQEPVPVGEDFERAVAVDGFAELRLLLQNGVHQLLLAHALGIVDFEGGSHVEKLRNVKRFEVGKMHGVGGCSAAL